MTGPETAPGTVALRELPGWPRISLDYVEKAGRAAEFFNGDFRDPAAFERQAEAVRSRDALAWKAVRRSDRFSPFNPRPAPWPAC